MQPEDNTIDNVKPLSNRREFLATGAAAAGLAGFGLTPAMGAGGGSHSHAGMESIFAAPMQGGEYLLPDLPYAYDALKPVIDEQTMRLHHDIHFNGYRKGLNSTFAKLEAARESGDFGEIAQLQSALAFHGAGYFLHLVFFGIMGPTDTSTPSRSLVRMISAHFGSLEKMKAHFAAASKGVQGSGWGVLGYQPVGGRLVILQVEKHQNHTQWGVVPIIPLDVWEHAYYLNYQNRRGDYVDGFWRVVDWEKVEQRLDAVLAMTTH